MKRLFPPGKLHFHMFLGLIDAILEARIFMNISTVIFIFHSRMNKLQIPNSNLTTSLQISSLDAK